MPRNQEEAMIDSLDDVTTLLDVLSKTSIENAKASREEDKRDILALVEEKFGFLW
eukprot:CAMPEP_0203672036 /NCGR_PEP_ID=MMETSP0090-20130426/7658_1 /ASSEMBLY_ACC=CAM_ASM_001088 /TAXON_ID=426623 /ORGANISM="Chaetoceros affinis, Strain CCMP159" /LENGTH=54 /DNA_ID=CAMNT_0050537255 /DNA_START=352 /DNA_END=513 /DNA_ORIENTATION=-